jgi:hypothetical protein
MSTRRSHGGTRAIFAVGGPRSLQGLRTLLQAAWICTDRLLSVLGRLVSALVGDGTQRSPSIGG